MPWNMPLSAGQPGDGWAGRCEASDSGTIPRLQLHRMHCTALFQDKLLCVLSAHGDCRRLRSMHDIQPQKGTINEMAFRFPSPRCIGPCVQPGCFCRPEPRPGQTSTCSCLTYTARHTAYGSGTRGRGRGPSCCVPTLAVVKSCHVVSWLLSGIQTLRGAVASVGMDGTMALGLASGSWGGAEDGRRNGESRYGLGIWGKPRQRRRVVGRDRTRRPGSGATAGWRHVEFENGLDGGARPGLRTDGRVVGSGSGVPGGECPPGAKPWWGGTNGMSRAKPTKDRAIWKCSNKSAGVGCPCFGRLFGLTD